MKALLRGGSISSAQYWEIYNLDEDEGTTRLVRVVAGDGNPFEWGAPCDEEGYEQVMQKYGHLAPAVYFEPEIRESREQDEAYAEPERTAKAAAEAAAEAEAAI